MNNRKHAYCIMAHNEPLVLQKLVELIDDERNDIYIHYDKKCDISIFEKVEAKKSNLYVLEKRIDVRWGDISQVECELLLFEEAMKGDYAIYHLLSGVDLPIKSQDYIHNLVAENEGMSFVSFNEDDFNKSLAKERTQYRWFFTKDYAVKRGASRVKSIFAHSICMMLIFIQKVFRVKRDVGVVVKKGPNWCSISNGLCHYLVEKKEYILKLFRWTMCPDEMFLQTMVYNSEFRDKVSSNGYLRLIDWTRDVKPWMWQETSKDMKILQGGGQPYLLANSPLKMIYTRRLIVF